MLSVKVCSLMCSISCVLILVELNCYVSHEPDEEAGMQMNASNVTLLRSRPFHSEVSIFFRQNWPGLLSPGSPSFCATLQAMSWAVLTSSLLILPLFTEGFSVMSTSASITSHHVVVLSFPRYDNAGVMTTATMPCFPRACLIWKSMSLMFSARKVHAPESC